MFQMVPQNYEAFCYLKSRKDMAKGMYDISPCLRSSQHFSLLNTSLLLPKNVQTCYPQFPHYSSSGQESILDHQNQEETLTLLSLWIPPTRLLVQIKLVLCKANFHLLHTANNIIVELVFGSLCVSTIAICIE